MRSESIGGIDVADVSGRGRDLHHRGQQRGRAAGMIAADVTVHTKERPPALPQAAHAQGGQR